MRTVRALVVCACAVVIRIAAQSPVLPDDEIRKVLRDRIDARQSVGIVVGVVEPNSRRLVTYGAASKDVPNRLDGDTIFEIGSITKVFTALLLSDMALRGQIALDDPIGNCFPEGMRAPQQGRPITMRDLATHTSGLPRLPADLLPKNNSNPYADYTVQQLYRFVSKYELTRDVGSKYEYSNLGVGLLGNCLAQRSGMSYEELVKARVTTPLGMKSTSITLSAEQKKRLAVGHNGKLEPVENWDLPALAGAGALRSTANDMLAFVAANLAYSKTNLTPAMAAMLETRRPTGNTGLEIALGWHVLKRDTNEIVWHNGGTGGYRSFIGFSSKSRVGVVVLSNSSNSVDDIGMRLLDSNAMETSKRKEVPANPKAFDGYVGRYQLAPNFIMNVTRESDHLFVQATGQPKFELFAAADHVYFLKVVEAEITFQVDAEGRATQLTLRQNGATIPAKRIEGEIKPPPARREVPIEANVLEGYVGRYQLAPGFLIEVTRQDAQLFIQATAQPKFPAFAESQRMFFLKIVDAQLTFEVDDKGRANRLTLHQNGRDLSGTRIE